MTAARFLKEALKDAERTLNGCRAPDCCWMDERARGRAEVLTTIRTVLPSSEADYVIERVREAAAIETPVGASGLRAQRRGGKPTGVSMFAARSTAVTDGASEVGS